MFKWYEGPSLTNVDLRGVRSTSQRGDLVRSVWNTRAWIFQEYHASKVVRFYWTPHLNLNVPNYEESSEIISEMEQTTGVSAQLLKELRPGARCHPGKVMSGFPTRDEAYSLLGIFFTSSRVVYGKGAGRSGYFSVLAQLLTSSGDTRILARTGEANSFNSCLPANIVVFSHGSRTFRRLSNRLDMDLIDYWPLLSILPWP